VTTRWAAAQPYQARRRLAKPLGRDWSRPSVDIGAEIGPAACRDREGSRNEARLFEVALSVIDTYPREVFLREYVPRWLEFGRAIKCANIEMRFGRQPGAFTSQGRSAPGAKPAPGFSRRRIELGYFAFGDRISRLFECYEYRSRCAAMLTATLAMAPIYSLRPPGRDKTDCAA